MAPPKDTDAVKLGLCGSCKGRMFLNRAHSCVKEKTKHKGVNDRLKTQAKKKPAGGSGASSSSKSAGAQ